MRYEVQRSISPDHPSLAGHFPGRPIVPGVVILTELIRATDDWLDWDPDPVSVSSAKFLRPLRPGEPFMLRLEQLSAHEVSFAVLRKEVRIAAGRLLRERPAGDQDRP